MLLFLCFPLCYCFYTSPFMEPCILQTPRLLWHTAGFSSRSVSYLLVHCCAISVRKEECHSFICITGNVNCWYTTSFTVLLHSVLFTNSHRVYIRLLPESSHKSVSLQCSMFWDGKYILENLPGVIRRVSVVGSFPHLLVIQWSGRWLVLKTRYL